MIENYSFPKNFVRLIPFLPLEKKVIPKVEIDRSSLISSLVIIIRIYSHFVTNT